MTRARRLLAARIKFIGHPSFDDAPDIARILGPTPEPDGDKDSHADEAPAVYRPAAESGESQLLTREQEIHLFRKMNFLKYVAARLREAIDPDAAVAAEIDRVEILLRDASAILDRIVGSNLGLVISIAKKRPDRRGLLRSGLRRQPVAAARRGAVRLRAGLPVQHLRDLGDQQRLRPEDPQGEGPTHPVRHRPAGLTQVPRRSTGRRISGGGATGRDQRKPSGRCSAISTIGSR